MTYTLKAMTLMKEHRDDTNDGKMYHVLGIEESIQST